MRPIAILGTGMAGFGAAHRLTTEGAPFLCYEKHSHVGGHTATYATPNGFLFDDGPHVSFAKDERIQDLFAASVNHKYEVIPARLNNYWRGYWITHPAQVNLFGLPTDLVVNILRDFIESRDDAGRPIKHYADWLYAAYGATFAETFPIEYGLKYHTTTADNMSTEWLGPRMYRPSLEEILRGALTATPTTDVHYVTKFRYPTHGGFGAYLRPLAAMPQVRLGHEVVGLDPRRHELRFSNGVTAEYEQVVSSIPLPDLIPLIDDTPAEVTEAAGRLAFTTAVMVNLGIDREDLSDVHITYFYDSDIIFPRISFPHMLSPNTVPPGSGSIQVETYFSDKYRPLSQPPESLIEPVLRDLRKTGVLREDDRVVFQEARVARYANVIYDLERAEALKIVHGFLDDIGVLYCGRYGDWNHEWTDEAFLSGEQAAQAALDGKR